MNLLCLLWRIVLFGGYLSASAPPVFYDKVISWLAEAHLVWNDFTPPQTRYLPLYPFPNFGEIFFQKEKRQMTTIDPKLTF